MPTRGKGRGSRGTNESQEKKPRSSLHSTRYETSGDSIQQHGPNDNIEEIPMDDSDSQPTQMVVEANLHYQNSDSEEDNTSDACKHAVN